MEKHMDDSNGNATLERHDTQEQDTHEMHKLMKQERRLLERLQEAREAELRSMDRFQRAQAKLQRRQARVARLEQRLDALRGGLASPALAEEQPDPILSANGHNPPEERAQEAPLAVVIAMSESAEGTDVVVLEAVTISPEEEETLEILEILEVQEVEEALATASERDTIEVEPYVTPELRSEAEVLVEPGEQEQPVELPQVEPVPVQVEPVQEEVSQTEAPLVPEQKTPEQIYLEAQEEWKTANTAAHLARNRAQDMAASISTLAQSGLSGTLMEELLRKQSDANKALNEAQQTARLAYEQLIQAEQSYQSAR